MGLGKKWSEWLKYRNVPFDIDLTIWERFPNDLVPTTYYAKYEVENIRQANGNLERRYLVYVINRGRGPFAKDYIYIPFFDSTYQQYTSNRKHLSLLKVDKDTYLPITFKEGQMFAEIEHFVYETEPVLDAEGNPTKDAEGNAVEQFKVDDKGRKIIKKDEAGNPMKYVESRLIFDSRVMLDNEKLVDLPLVRAVRTYDPDQWVAQELIVANTEFNPAESPWVKYAPYIVAGLTICACILIAFLTMQHIDGKTDELIAALKGLGNVKFVSGTAANPPNLTPPPA